MTDKRQILIDTSRTIAIFIGTWGAIQALPTVLPESYDVVADFLFMAVYMGFAGIFLPIRVEYLLPLPSDDIIPLYTKRSA